MIALLLGLLAVEVVTFIAWRSAASKVVGLRLRFLDQQTCVSDPYARPAPAEETTTP